MPLSAILRAARTRQRHQENPDTFALPNSGDLKRGVGADQSGMQFIFVRTEA